MGAEAILALIIGCAALYTLSYILGISSAALFGILFVGGLIIFCFVADPPPPPPRRG